MVNHLSYDTLMRALERRLSADEDIRARRHLARCGRCRSEREWLERIRTHSDPIDSGFRRLQLN
jgi:hypothetical protein